MVLKEGRGRGRRGRWRRFGTLRKKRGSYKLSHGNLLKVYRLHCARFDFVKKSGRYSRQKDEEEKSEREKK